QRRVDHCSAGFARASAGRGRGREEFGNVNVKGLAQLLQRVEGDVLLEILDAHDGGLRQAGFAREIALRGVSPPFLDESCQPPAQMNHMWFILWTTNHMWFS